MKFHARLQADIHNLPNYI